MHHYTFFLPNKECHNYFRGRPRRCQNSKERKRRQKDREAQKKPSYGCSPFLLQSHHLTAPGGGGGLAGPHQDAARAGHCRRGVAGGAFAAPMPLCLFGPQVLKKKFFFSDQSIDKSDPVQINLLYSQASRIFAKWSCSNCSQKQRSSTEHTLAPKMRLLRCDTCSLSLPRQYSRTVCCDASASGVRRAQS